MFFLINISFFSVLACFSALNVLLTLRVMTTAVIFCILRFFFWLFFLGFSRFRARSFDEIVVLALQYTISNVDRSMLEIENICEKRSAILTLPPEKKTKKKIPL